MVAERSYEAGAHRSGLTQLALGAAFAVSVAVTLWLSLVNDGSNRPAPAGESQHAAAMTMSALLRGDGRVSDSTSTFYLVGSTEAATDLRDRLTWLGDADGAGRILIAGSAEGESTLWWPAADEANYRYFTRVLDLR